MELMVYKLHVNLLSVSFVKPTITKK